MEKVQILKKALGGDINSFQQLFIEFQDQLKSYLYRLLANRNDAEDILHDTFIRAFDKISSYKGESSLKTWVFQIATNIALNELKKRKRWTEDSAAQAKSLVMNSEKLASQIVATTQTSAYGRYEIREHIDTCFTCIGKTLLVENQIALILKDIYEFSIQEIGQIIDKTAGVVKYLLQDGRRTMMNVFDKKCALVNKEGICNQCSELNGWLNPKQNQQEAVNRLSIVKGSKKYNREQLYELRRILVKNIDPLQSEGHELQEKLMQCNRIAMGEIKK
ncbi:MAG: RNA polymerase sigma factor [Bacteroidota bacterium]